ncbi:MAG: hypothetical protein SOX46_12840 [Clostridiaceae bacterium]|uniref:Uncharacterized protein n=1 Tax=Clostridium porci TaxID=2605778 RepID=A0A7X2TFB9_9CLOT|nr:hypothetical protein [Clostridium porci]MCI7179562.1 hypothetical protein [Lachnospiraceae bacterium]MDY3232437.1 hypothetical protein [Clostridiaceae bacterium]MSS38756.1 hypothetical protein [Clostridium porci]
MMDKECVREMLNNIVDSWLLGKCVSLSWIRGQIFFAYMIGAITTFEKEELLKRVSESKEVL